MSTTTIVKITNDKSNVITLHNKIFSPDSLGVLNGDETILICEMGNPLHYIWLRRDYPNLNIYGIEDYKLEPTFHYCLNELNCNIIFNKKPDDINEWNKCIKIIQNKSKKMKFDISVGNPAFGGDGNPLFMKIIRIIYDNYLNDKGIIRMVHPTTLVDNKFGLDVYSEYAYLKVISFDFSKELRDIFSGANIGNGIGIFTYGKDGRNSIFDDEIKAIRYGSDYYKDKEIIEKILSNCDKTIKDNPKYVHISSKKELKVNELNNKYNLFVSFARNRGNIDKKTGGLKWDWTTLQSEDYLKVLNELNSICQNVVPVNNKKEGVDYIKWCATDFVNYIVLYFKNNMSNNPALFKCIPQPIPSGDFSDESIMKHFGLSKEQMSYIHTKVKNYGWKAHYNCSEEEMLQKIEEMNS